MKAPEFAYERPSSLDGALEFLADHGDDAQPIAGGQSLVPMMNFRLAQPTLLVDLNNIPELSGVSVDHDSIAIGAMTRYAALQQSTEIADELPLVAAALPHVAHPAIRNRGTIGGSLALADPAAELPAVMLALDASMTVRSVNGAREVAAEDFFSGVYETALEPGEILTKVTISRDSGQRPFAFREIARRHGDYAMAGVVVTAARTPALADVRCACFAVGDCATRCAATETALEGTDPADPTAIAAAIDGLDTLRYNGDLHASAAMKRHLSGVLLKRALADLS